MTDSLAAEETGPLSAGERRDRTRARAWALQAHYLWEAHGEEGLLTEALAECARTRRISPPRLALAHRLLGTLDDHLEEVDRAVQERITNWSFSRLSSIDRGILRLAATELLYLEDIPFKTSIVEAVHLAEAYGGNESPRFVNGVLDALHRGDERED